MRPEKGAPTASQGKYLQAICRLSRGGQRVVFQRDVVRWLNCSKPSVSRAAALLRQQGWLEPDRRDLALTPEGLEWALRLCQARRQLETLGVPETAAAPAAAVLLAAEGAERQEQDG